MVLTGIAITILTSKILPRVLDQHGYILYQGAELAYMVERSPSERDLLSARVRILSWTDIFDNGAPVESRQIGNYACSRLTKIRLP